MAPPVANIDAKKLFRTCSLKEKAKKVFLTSTAKAIRFRVLRLSRTTGKGWAALEVQILDLASTIQTTSPSREERCLIKSLGVSPLCASFPVKKAPRRWEYVLKAHLVPPTSEPRLSWITFWQPINCLGSSCRRWIRRATCHLKSQLKGKPTPASP